jgi:hypothetical protein
MDKRTKTRWVAAVLAALLASQAVASAVLEGYRFDERARVASRELQLNGLGVRAVFVFKAFVAALYLEEKAREGAQVLGHPGAKRLQLRMLMDIGAADIKKALFDGIRKNVSAAEWAAMQERLERLGRTIDAIGMARTGDTITLDYVPQQGLLLSLNDQPQGATIAGADIYHALLAIFVGDDPVDTRLRSGLLGQ